MWPVLGAAAVLHCAVTGLLPAAQLLLQLNWENLEGQSSKCCRATSAQP